MSLLDFFFFQLVRDLRLLSSGTPYFLYLLPPRPFTNVLYKPYSLIFTEDRSQHYWQTHSKFALSEQGIHTHPAMDFRPPEHHKQQLWKAGQHTMLLVKNCCGLQVDRTATFCKCLVRYAWKKNRSYIQAAVVTVATGPYKETGEEVSCRRARGQRKEGQIRSGTFQKVIFFRD